MVDKKLTELDAITSITADDLIYVVDDPLITPVSKKITVSNFFKYLAYPLDIAPVSPHASDDEFDGVALDGKWTNPITSTSTNTISLANSWLTFEPSTAGDDSTAKRGAWGIQQSSPAGSFSASAKIALTRPFHGNADDTRCGVFVAISSGTAKANMSGFQTSVPAMMDALGAPYDEDADWGGYDGFVVVASDLAPYLGLWYKISWDSGTSIITFYASFNGVAWTPFTTRGSMSQPDRMGVCMYSNTGNTYADRKVNVDWFRVTEP
jgi:hypothetical protein